MPVFNNPGFQQGFQNLAAMFAPPSGQEAAYWATAKAKNAETSRLQKLFDYRNDPNYSREQAERMSFAVGQTNGTNGYYAQDQNDATTRYKVDADNARAIRDREMQEAGSLTRQMLQPVKLNQGETAILPQATADATGLDQRLAGAAKPLSEAEVKGAERQDLRGRGLLTDRDLIDTILGDKPPVQAVGPDGKTPTFMSPGAAVRTGAQPYVKPTNDQMSPLARLMQERDALPEGDPRRAAYDQNIAALGRGQQQSAYDRTNDEGLAKLNDDIYKNAVGATADRNLLHILQSAVASPDAPQGALAGTNLALRKMLNTFGVDAGDTSEAEMINALGAQLSLKLRNPSEGGGMPGSLSDSDRNFLQSMTVSLGNSPEANRKLVDYYLRIQQKNLDLEGLRRDYVAKNGRVDEGFRAAVGDYLQKSGIYADGGDARPEAGGAGHAVTPAPASGQVSRPTSDAEFNALPAGALYVDPDDGRTYRK